MTFTENMRSLKGGFIPAVLLALACVPASAVAEGAPIDIGMTADVVVVARHVTAVNYRKPGGVGMHLDFAGTPLAPDAHGDLDVDSKKGYVQIQSTVHGLPPASTFGDEYMTYVLWAITPEGRATNLGEFLVDQGDSRSRLEVTSEMQAFGMIVTAEPHFGVTMPSNVVVLENVIPADSQQVETVDAKYELLERGAYAFNGASRSDLEAPSVPFYVVQARNARRIAKDAGAEHWAADAFARGDAQLHEAEAPRGGKARMAVAKQAAQTFEDARLMSVKRAREERELRAQQDASQARSEADSARSAASSAEEDAALARERAAEADRLRLEAEQGRATAEAEKAALRARLLTQFKVLFDTRDTARGLILNMSDVLFDFNRSTLRPAAREKLAKLSGVLLANKGLQLAVEGHADAIGTDEYNQSLSEHRANAVRDYLVGQGVSGNDITATGFGESKPVASNDTPEGRQLNRRVEIVVSGDVIGATVIGAGGMGSGG